MPGGCRYTNDEQLAANLLLITRYVLIYTNV